VSVDFSRISFVDSGDTGAWVADAMSHFHVNSKAKRSSLQAAQVVQFLKSSPGAQCSDDCAAIGAARALLCAGRGTRPRLGEEH
jgi:hypothetical protein